MERGLPRDTAEGGGARTALRPRDRLAVGATFRIERYSLRRSHRVVTLSEYMASEARCRFGTPASKVSVIPPGVDTAVFAPGDRARARERLGLVPGAFIVLSVRRLARRMGLDLLLRAAQRVCREHADMLVVVEEVRSGLR